LGYVRRILLAAVVVHDGMHDLVPLVPELLCPA